MPRILIIEDDEKLREELKIFLNKNGYEATALTTFDNTINDILKINPDLILLDINLPNTDGEYICKEIRKKSNMPIIIVTSRDNEIDELLSIMECLWESESFIDDNTLTVNITRLRNKLEELELKELLETKRGQGYILKKGVN